MEGIPRADLVFPVLHGHDTVPSGRLEQTTATVFAYHRFSQPSADVVIKCHSHLQQLYGLRTVLKTHNLGALAKMPQFHTVTKHKAFVISLFC